MSEKIRLVLLLILVFCFGLNAFADEDDYILGINAFGDGLYSVSAPSLENYLKSGTDKNKKNYSYYLLYRIYLKKGEFSKAGDYFEKVWGVDDIRFDKKLMRTDRMTLLTKSDCKKAAAFAFSDPENGILDSYLSSKCPVDKDFVRLVLEKSTDDNIKLRAVTRVSDNPEMVKSIFGSMELKAMSNGAKRYFALYFYQHKDYDLFWKVRDVYEDADVVNIELDRYWVKGDKDLFLERFNKYKSGYRLNSVNACRAVDIYVEKGADFDCGLVDDCLKEQTTELAGIKGACLAKKGDADKITAFIDSLNDKSFSGICGYGEYIFANGLYKGAKAERFFQCSNKYGIGDVLVQKKYFKTLTAVFKNGSADMDRYYTAIGLAGQGKKTEAQKTASKIQDANIKAKLSGASK